MHQHSPKRDLPQRWQAVAFRLKIRSLQMRRGFAEIGKHPTAFGKPPPSRETDQNGQMMGIRRQDVTQQMMFSGMPTRRKSVKR